MLNAKLVVVGGDAKKTEVRLKLPTLIGRGQEAGLTVPHALVSRRHAEIIERDGRLFVRDMGSLNGTYVNNTRIEGEQPLDPDQLLTLGNITFRAVYEVQSELSEATTANSETVTFDEVKTLSGLEERDSIEVHLPAGKPQVASLDDGNSFDETTPVDFVSSTDQPVETSMEKPAYKPEPSRDTASQRDPVGQPSASGVLEDQGGSELMANDTDKSVIDGTTDDSSLGESFFALATDETDPAGKSVSASALNDLPAGRSAVSFLGHFESEDQIKKPISQLDPDEIDLGEDQKKAALEPDSSLGSFLRKLPR